MGRQADVLQQGKAHGGITTASIPIWMVNMNLVLLLAPLVFSGLAGEVAPAG